MEKYKDIHEEQEGKIEFYYSQSPNTKCTLDLVLLSPSMSITLKNVLGFSSLNSGSLL